VAKRSRESFQKRAREKARQDKQAEKREKRQTRESSDDVSRKTEDSLMQEFARLNSRYEANEISHDAFNEERHRIFVELGLEPE